MLVNPAMRRGHGYPSHAVGVGFVICFLPDCRSWFASFAGGAFEDVSVVQKTIQHGGDGGTITEQLSPVFNVSVRCNQRLPAVALHDDFQQFLGGG